MVNKVILIGNVGADPEIRTFEDGNKVARVNLATTERVFNSKTQERTEHTEWHRLIIWRGLATVVEQYVRKGSQLYIEGKIRSNEWTDANGQKRYGVDIIVDVMNMLGRKDASQQGGYSQSSSNNPFTQPAAREVAPTQETPQGMGAYQPKTEVSYENTPEDTDDLPF